MAKTADGSKKKKKSKSNLKKKLSVLNSEAIKKKAPKENPFESIWSRRKFNILGKKRKEEERRRIGHSRSIGLQKRQNTLLKEYEQSKKSSVFVDNRIGEQSEALGEFDKAILRSQRERQLNLKKKSKYNISDGEEDDFEIPEGGYFPERDDYEDDEPLYDDDDEAGQSLGGEKKLSFGQLNPDEVQDGLESTTLEGQENRHKSKKEVMEEIIFKSKLFKAQKAKEKEENEQFNIQLDKNYDSLVQSKALQSLSQPNGIQAHKDLANSNILNVDAKEVTPSAHKKLPLQKVNWSLQDKPDDYEKIYGEVALDQRGRASDRIKAPEELAQEEKERLEQLEKERVQRMASAADSSDEDDSSEEDDDSEKQVRHISGDDLGDSFSRDAKPAIPRTTLSSIEEIFRRENDDEEDDEEDDDDDDEDDDVAEGSDEDHVENKKAQSLKDWEQSDDENIETGLEEEEDDEDEDDGDGTAKRVKMVNSKKKPESLGKPKESVKDNVHNKGELPYTIEAPQNIEELTELFENRSEEQIVEAIRRIRTFNAHSLAAENRKKMQVFYGVLLQYFAVLANEKPLNFNLLNILVKPLIEISTELPYFSAICARVRLSRIRAQFLEDVKNTGKSCWPSLKTLFLLRLWSMIFPCSDYRHAVMTPATLLMSEYLMRCPIISGRDIAIGSFLCSLVLSVSRQSRKFCPEAITFIQTMLMAALNNKQTNETSQLYHLMELKTLRPLLSLQGHVQEISSLDFLMLMDLPDDSPYFTSDKFRASILSAIIGNLKGFVNIYEELKSFPEIFLPISKVLHELEEEDLVPDALKGELKSIAQHIQDKSQEYYLLRQPLRLRKVKIIKTAVPKFEENFVKGRDYDPDRERSEMKKLRKRLRKEAKGAVRELRKDNYFLSVVKARDKAYVEQEKAEKSGKTRAFLQEQEHAFKSGQLGKGKGKKRRR
ncbi:hypothetical protein ABFX02_05G024100 [Erythranthe guttata]